MMACDDCGRNTADEYFMVHDAIWTEAGLRQRVHMTEPHCYLCILCLEARLGRELTPGDFTDHPVNRRPARRSEILQDRLN